MRYPNRHLEIMKLTLTIWDPTLICFLFLHIETGMESTTSFTTGFQQSSTHFTDDIENLTEIPVSVSPTNGSTPVCLIDPQLAFIVALSSMGLIIILLISTMVLACKVVALKRQCQSRRPTRSNVDLVSGTGYWGTETIEGGIVGPCETNLLLEEVRTDAEDDEKIQNKTQKK
uniref:Uncharacterized protein n=1 Tax=Astyanax mexicanus TaxID=7994 RepID=A0A8B9K0X6_ASTMX